MITLEEIFKRQESISSAFDQCDNYKDFFVNYDGLHNLEQDIAFTLKGRYECKLGCQICLLNDVWLDDVPIKDITIEHEERLLDLFSYFSSVACVDDLRDIKNNHPKLFEFYKRHANKMEFHTSDNGFFSQYDILMNDLRFKEIGQISFSDHLLGKSSGSIVDDIINRLSNLNARSPISRINFVITEKIPEQNENVMKLCDWLANIDQTLAIYFHNDVRTEEDLFATLREELGYSQPSCYHIEHSTNPPTNCSILSETVHLRYDNFFPDLYTSMDESCPPFDKLNEDFDINAFFVSVLKEKKRMYNSFREKMAKKTKLYEYFSYVADNLVINENFTYIPALVLNPISVMYQQLAASAYTNSFAGLMKRNELEVIPIIGWKDV